MPPSLEKRKVQLPNIDFFTQCLYSKNFQNSFSHLHKLMKCDINNIQKRRDIQSVIGSIIDKILLVAFTIRQYEAEWSNSDYYSNLPKNQRIWLDDIYHEQREEQEEWREEISQEIAIWILRSYEKLIHGYYMLGDAELQKIQESVIEQIVFEAIKQEKEFF